MKWGWKETGDLCWISKCWSWVGRGDTEVSLSSTGGYSSSSQMDSLKLGSVSTCDCLRSRTSSRCERILSGYINEDGLWGVDGMLKDPWSLLLKDKQTSDFLEVHLAHQIVLLFIKAAVLRAWLPWVFVLSSWYLSNQSLLFITSRCSRKQKWLQSSKDVSVPPEGEIALLSHSSWWMAWGPAIWARRDGCCILSAHVREGWYWGDAWQWKLEHYFHAVGILY